MVERSLSMREARGSMPWSSIFVILPIGKDFAGKNELIKLKAAYAEEGIFVGAEHLSELCAIKSKNELIADVIALLQSPAQRVIGALQNKGGEDEGEAAPEANPEA